MPVKLLPQRDERQMNPLKSSQQRFSCGTLRRPFGIARIQPCQVFLLVSQPLAHLELQQGQDAQADREQAHQTSRALGTLDIHGRERERFAFQASKAMLHQVFFTVGQDRLLQGQPRCGVIGDIDAPSQAARRSRDLRFIDGRVQAQGALDPHGSRTVPIGPHGSLLHLFFDTHLHQSVDLVLLEDGLGGLLQHRPIRIAFFALFVLIEPFQLGLGFGQTGVQGCGRSRGELVGTHDQLPFRPTDRPSCYLARERNPSLVSLSHRFRLARFPFTPDGGQGLLACPHRLQVLVQDLLWHLLGRQRTQIVVLLGLQIRPGVQGGHLAIPDVEQPVGVQALAHLSNGRKIQPIVGSFPRHDLCRDRQPQWIQGRQHHLELRQVGTVVFAVPQLEQPLFGHRPIPTDRGTIDPHPFGLEVVHPDELSVQRRLKLLPLLLIAQGIQHQGQAVIAKASLTDFLPGTDGQGLHPMGCPALHLIHPMIPFRHDVRQPDGCRPAQAHSLPVAMRLEVVIQQLWYTHLVTVGQQERNIVHSFCRNTYLFCHADSLPHLQNLVTFWPNHEYISNNRLTALPESLFENLSNLAYLNVTDNQLTALPGNIGNLTNLKELRVFNNHLTALPESLGNLRSLSYLDVRANRLISLPASIGDLTHLEKLDVRWNKLISPPRWLQRLEQRGCTVFR